MRDSKQIDGADHSTIRAASGVLATTSDAADKSAEPSEPDWSSGRAELYHCAAGAPGELLIARGHGQLARDARADGRI